MTWHVSLFTLIPELYPGVFAHSLPGKALDRKIWAYSAINLRDFSPFKYGNVDDTPAGGGAGLVIRPDILAAAIDSHENLHGADDRPLYALSPRGQVFNQDIAKGWAKGSGVRLICGRFEGIDERILEARNVREISLGDFVLCGGDVAAMTMIEATVRLLDGVVQKKESLDFESFENGLLEHPHYTRPAIWEERPIPEVLLSGNHAKINRWRLQQSEKITQENRPDLWKTYCQRNKPVV